MNSLPPALQFLLLTFAGWVNRRPQKVISCLLAENRVLRQQLGGRRLRLTNFQRRRLAAMGKLLGRKLLRILTESGIVPAPERGGRTPWKTFLKAHWEALAATDFFTVEVLTLFGLVRYHVLFVIELNTRRIEIAGITRHATGDWMMQVGRNITDEVDGFLRDKRYLILDRDPVCTEKLEQLMDDSGVMDNELIAPAADELENEGPVRCRERQGGATVRDQPVLSRRKDPLRYQR